MSLLGFNAIGRFALGQTKSVGLFLTASTAAYVVNGPAASFRISEAAAATTYGLSGAAALFKIAESSLAGAFSITGSAALFSVLLQANTAGYSITGNAGMLTRDFINWLPRPFVTDAWTEKRIQAETWTRQLLK